jgi:hypothetical protein
VAAESNFGSRLRHFAFERGGLLTLLALIVYAVLAPTHIVAADNAEFATLSVLGGHAHPSGYPLYILYLRLTSWLPGATAAHAASLATSVLGAAVVFVLQSACRAWGARPGAAALAVAILAGAGLVLRVHTEADVFALNSLLAATILWVAAPRSPLTCMRRAAALGLLAGLALSNNLTCALIAPIGIYGVVATARDGRPVRVMITTCLALLLGLTPYLYLVVGPDNAASWAPVHTVQDFLDTVLRKDYGYTTHVPGHAAISTATSLVRHATLIGRTWLWLPFAGGVAMLGVQCFRSANRWAWRMLAASWLLCGPIFAARLGVEAVGVGAYIGGRMQILSALVLALPIASSFEWLLLRRPLSNVRAIIAAVVVFLILAAAAWPKLARVHGSAVEDGVENLLASLPKNSVVFVVSEDQCFGTRYLQLVSGKRPDVTIVCTSLLSRSWYRDRLPLNPDAGAVLATGRPLLVDGAQSTILRAFPSYPDGILHRVLATHDVPPPLDIVVERQRVTFSRFALVTPRPGKSDDFAAVAFRRYALAWKELSGALERAGDHAQSLQALEVAHQLEPD